MESNTVPTAAKTRSQARRLASCIATGLGLVLLTLAFASHDFGALLCAAIAFASGLLLLFNADLSRGRRAVTLLVLAGYLSLQSLILANYKSVRDQVRWTLLSGRYKAQVMEQAAPPDHRFRHVEWDGWGFVGMDTTEFLVFDATDSLSKQLDAQPPIKAVGLPCEVVGVRRLASQWYAVLFYTETYWGQQACK